MIQYARSPSSYTLYSLLFFPVVVSARDITEPELLAAIAVRAFPIVNLSSDLLSHCICIVYPIACIIVPVVLLGLALTLCCRRRQSTTTGGPSLREKGWKGYLFPDLPGGVAPVDMSQRGARVGITEERPEDTPVIAQEEAHPEVV